MVKFYLNYIYLIKNKKMGICQSAKKGNPNKQNDNKPVITDAN